MQQNAKSEQDIIEILFDAFLETATGYCNTMLSGWDVEDVMRGNSAEDILETLEYLVQLNPKQRIEDGFITLQKAHEFVDAYNNDIELDDNLKYDEDIQVPAGYSTYAMKTLLDPEAIKKDYNAELTYSAKGTSLSLDIKAESIKDQTFTIPDYATIKVTSLDAEGSINLNDKGYITNAHVKASANVTITMSPVLNDKSYNLNFDNGDITLTFSY